MNYKLEYLKLKKNFKGGLFKAFGQNVKGNNNVFSSPSPDKKKTLEYKPTEATPKKALKHNPIKATPISEREKGGLFKAFGQNVKGNNDVFSSPSPDKKKTLEYKPTEATPISERELCILERDELKQRSINNSELIRIIKSHGAVIDKFFTIPEDTYIITLSEVADSVKFHLGLDREIVRFCKDALFFNDDNKTKLKTNEAKLLENTIMGKLNKLHFANHGPGEEMTDMSLDFFGTLCAETDYDEGSGGYACGVSFLNKENNALFALNKDEVNADTSRRDEDYLVLPDTPTFRERRFISQLIGVSAPLERRYPLKTGNSTLLSTIIDTYGHGIYIVIACRSNLDEFVNITSLRQKSYENAMKI